MICIYGHTDGSKHDCAYVDARNALIPEAVAAANKAAGVPSIGELQRRTWDTVFHAEMDKLWAARTAVLLRIA